MCDWTRDFLVLHRVILYLKHQYLFTWLQGKDNKEEALSVSLEGISEEPRNLFVFLCFSFFDCLCFICSIQWLLLRSKWIRFPDSLFNFHTSTQLHLSTHYTSIRVNCHRSSFCLNVIDNQRKEELKGRTWMDIKLWSSKTIKIIWSKTMNDNHHNMRNVSKQIILFRRQTLLFCWNHLTKKIARDESCEGGDKSFLWDPLGGGWIWTKRRRWGTFSQEMMGWPKSFHRIRLQIDV